MTSFVSAEGGPIWIKFRRLVQNDMSTAFMWSKSKSDVEIQWRTFGRIQWDVIPEPPAILQGAATWRTQCHDSRATCHIAGCCHRAKSMACHPRATYHIAGCCHLVNSMSRFQSYVSHCRVLPPGEFNGISSQSHVSHCRVLPLGEFNVTIPEPHATLQGAVCSHLAKSMSRSCHIGGCKNSIRHIENRFSP